MGLWSLDGLQSAIRCNRALTNTYWNTSTELNLSLTTVKVGALLGIALVQRKIGDYGKTLVTSKRITVINIIRSYNSCISVCPDLIILM